MTNDQGNLTHTEVAQQRLNEVLEDLAQKGLTQRAVAGRVGLPPQYLSDLKRGDRTISELIARRLAEEFDFDYEWLLGISDTQKKPTLVAPSAGSAAWLPILPHPIEGDPRESPDWDGTGVELAGSAAAKLARAVQPYVLRFGHEDMLGRLCKRDLILISQDTPQHANIFVVKSRKKAFLARRQDDGTWQRVANGAILSKTSVPIGYCVGVIWSSL